MVKPPLGFAPVAPLGGDTHLLRRIGAARLGRLMIGVLWLAITGAWLLPPSFGWVSFPAGLNCAIWQLNGA